MSHPRFFKPTLSLARLCCITFLAANLLSCNQPSQPSNTSATVDTASHESPQVIALWPAGVPDSGLISGVETYKGGMVSNLSHPSITVYPPRGANSGVAVLVYPGGGYQKLAVELEGSEICEWLSSIGITGILLKYRVPNSGPHHDAGCDCQVDPVKPMALQDAQRSLRLVRLHATEWKIDPHKIGVMGFSAGGHLVADISTNYSHRVYPVADAADTISCRPDFAICFYPGHMQFHAANAYALNPGLPVNSHTPPTFLLQAGNDPVDTIQNSLVYYIALRKAGVPVEYHVFAEGGHAFGVHTNSQSDPAWAKLPIAGWPKLVERWLETIGMRGR